MCCFTSVHSFVSSLIAIIKKLEVHSHYCARLNSQSAGVERVKPNRTGLPQDKGRERKTDRQTDGRIGSWFVTVCMGNGVGGWGEVCDIGTGEG